MKTMLTTCLFTASLMLTLPSVFAQPVQIGYTNSVAVGAYSQALLDDVGRFRWFFAHASVGGNMVDEMSEMRAISSVHYPLRPVAVEGTPPASTDNGVVYEYMRGNPGAQVKFDSFGAYVTNGWRFPNVHLALNKLCYVDQDADVEYYLGSMVKLEAAFPETIFVYMTMPLTTASDDDNRKRNVYNDRVREWTRTNNLVLFDLADIEAHDTNGVSCLFTNAGRVCQRMYDGYSNDGGHLNPAGRRLAVFGFYALGAALLSTDRDGDGMSDGLELIAGTEPMRGSSVFKMQATNRPEGGISLNWPSATNRYYTLQRGANVAIPESFTNVLTDAPATPPVNVFTDSPAEPGPFFYRLEVHQ
jgi:hypothetical protein